MSIYCVAGRDNEIIDVSMSKKGAKNYATRHDYNAIYSRSNMGDYCVSLISIKCGKKWIDPEIARELYNFYLNNCVDETKGEIPLNFRDWGRNHLEEEFKNYNIIKGD